MIEWIAASLMVIACIGLLQAMRLTQRGHQVLDIALDSLEILSSPELGDQQKEAGLQRNSIKLFGLFLGLVIGFAVALLVPFGILWVADQVGLISIAAVMGVTLSIPFLIASTALIIFWLVFKGARSEKADDEDVNQYSSLDQALHRMSFKTYATQVSLAKIEDKIVAGKLNQLSAENPVFITALPRAGTTLLLECLADVPEFAAHCYRDMPFVLTPYFWDRYSSLFRQKSVESRERAHGDGMQISPDSPEALEEVLWVTFWKQHYKEDRIIPWELENHSEFRNFFESHMRKILYLRRDQSRTPTRYISKNNANIARINTLRHLFPSSLVLVPFRNPLHHAASLLQQHLNFLSIHQTDDFAAEYMRAIGHFDFGKNLCPIDFDNWLDNRLSPSAEELSFWLEYWVASYRYLLTKNQYSVIFLNYDALCENPSKGFSILADKLSSRDPDIIRERANRIGQPRPKQIDTRQIPKSLLQEVNELHEQLRILACN